MKRNLIESLKINIEQSSESNWKGADPVINNQLTIMEAWSKFSSC